MSMDRYGLVFLDEGMGAQVVVFRIRIFRITRIYRIGRMLGVFGCIVMLHGVCPALWILP